jgi:hypothetical protein
MHGETLTEVAVFSRIQLVSMASLSRSVKIQLQDFCDTGNDESR